MHHFVCFATVMQIRSPAAHSNGGFNMATYNDPITVKEPSHRIAEQSIRTNLAEFHFVSYYAG